MKRAALLLAVVLFAAGCAGDEEATETATATRPVESTTVKAYVLRDGKVWPVARGGGDVIDLLPKAALDALMAGPNDDQASELDAETDIPDGATAEVTVDDGIARVRITADELSHAAVAQIVYTMTGLPGVRAVTLEATLEAGAVVAASYTRADFEEQTPSVLVESPLPFEEVTSPITATGTANTFEATFHYELTDTDGRIVDEDFVTATSGTGTRGTFEFTTDDYEIPFDGIGSLIVFERSAEDGSRIHLVEIPLRMSK